MEEGTKKTMHRLVFKTDRKSTAEDVDKFREREASVFAKIDDDSLTSDVSLKTNEARSKMYELANDPVLRTILDEKTLTGIESLPASEAVGLLTSFKLQFEASKLEFPRHYLVAALRRRGIQIEGAAYTEYTLEGIDADATNRSVAMELLSQLRERKRNKNRNGDGTIPLYPREEDHNDDSASSCAVPDRSGETVASNGRTPRGRVSSRRRRGHRPLRY